MKNNKKDIIKNVVIITLATIILLSIAFASSFELHVHPIIDYYGGCADSWNFNSTIRDCTVEAYLVCKFDYFIKIDVTDQIDVVHYFVDYQDNWAEYWDSYYEYYGI